MNEASSENRVPESTRERAGELVYGIEDRPGTWWESLLFGWQHTLVDISPFVLPLAGLAWGTPETATPMSWH